MLSVPLIYTTVISTYLCTFYKKNIYIFIKIFSLLFLQKWWGLIGVPREFLSQLYWTLKKLPETKYVCVYTSLN